MNTNSPPIFFLFGLALLLTANGCSSATKVDPFVARVGTDYLYESDLVSAFDGLKGPLGDANARVQFVDRWVSSALLAQEAKRLGIAADPAVQRLLRDNERSILASAVVKSVFDESLEAAKASAITEYYEANRDRLRIREPYVRIRYLESKDKSKVDEARRLLQRALRGAGVDSLWSSIVVEHADDPDGSLFLSSNYFPESRLFGSSPEVRDRLLQLGKGQLSSVINSTDAYHVIQLVDRKPSGTVPELDWIRDDLGRQREQQTQKETYARLVQRLRAAAESRSEVEINDLNR
jgi:hypothetical protein